jgi:hypothetical protein
MKKWEELMPTMSMIPHGRHIIRLLGSRKDGYAWHFRYIVVRRDGSREVREVEFPQETILVFRENEIK